MPVLFVQDPESFPGSTPLPGEVSIQQILNSTEIQESATIEYQLSENNDIYFEVRAPGKEEPEPGEKEAALQKNLIFKETIFAAPQQFIHRVKLIRATSKSDDHKERKRVSRVGIEETITSPTGATKSRIIIGILT